MDKGHSRLSIDLFETDVVFMVSETFAVLGVWSTKKMPHLWCDAVCQELYYVACSQLVEGNGDHFW